MCSLTNNYLYDFQNKVPCRCSLIILLRCWDDSLFPQTHWLFWCEHMPVTEISICFSSYASGSKGSLRKVCYSPSFDALSRGKGSPHHGSPGYWWYLSFWKGLKVKESVGHSVVSDCLRPHRLPTRFLCPWDFLDKYTGVGCHSLLQAIFLTQGAKPGLLHCRQIPLQTGPLRSLYGYFTRGCYNFQAGSCRQSG